MLKKDFRARHTIAPNRSLLIKSGSATMQAACQPMALCTFVFTKWREECVKHMNAA